MDNTGALYITDTINNRIRKVAPDGTIITVAGNAREEPQGTVVQPQARS